MIAGSYESDKPNNITGMDKVRLTCDFIYERLSLRKSIVNGIREPIFYSFALDQPPGHKSYEQPRDYKPTKAIFADSSGVHSSDKL